MEGINFSALAPRYGSRPMLSGWSDIGISSMNGGAFNWGNLWSGLKSFGSSVKSWGNKAWQSNTAQALRQKLKDTDLQSKVVEGLASGIHGVVDLANQEIANAVQKRLEARPVPEVLVEDPSVLRPTEAVVEELEPPAASTLESVGTKRPPPEEELVIRTDEPPRYEDLYPDKSGPPLTLLPTAARPSAAVISRPSRPASRPARPAATVAVTTPASSPVLVEATPALTIEPPVAVPARPSRSRSNRGWQGTLNSIVGLGVHAIKRRRCF